MDHAKKDEAKQEKTTKLQLDRERIKVLPVRASVRAGAKCFPSCVNQTYAG